MAAISLCMIVKDEEQNIGRCLDSVRDYVGEMIIVDTGSQDRTKRICLEAGAKVYDFQWAQDFAQARNFGLQKASGDWILWLDADEELCARDFPGLETVLETRPEELIPVRLVHFYGEDPVDEHHAYRSTGFRLFKNGAGLSFTGAIHERLDISALGRISGMELCQFIYIKHYGYLDTLYERKARRNLMALLKQKEERPGDTWLDYHLAAEYYRAGEPVKAFETVNGAIVGFLKKGLVPPSLAYKLKYEILVAAESFDAAYPGIEKAVALYPDYVDLHFYQGRILFALERYNEAAFAFKYCLILGEADPRYLILAGSGSFYALHYLGLCYEAQQKYDLALQAYRQALGLYPGFVSAKERIQLLEEQFG